MRVQTLINGHPADCVSVTDRALAYGHGLFETLPVYDGHPVFLTDHLRRLLQGCARLGIPLDHLTDQLKQDFKQLELPQGAAVLKIIVTCGSGGRGYLTPDSAQPSRILMLSPMPLYPDRPEEGVCVRWCQTRLACQSALSGIKHLNRLEQVLARNEWNDPAIREGLVLDSDGHVIEGTMSNLCFIRNGLFCTPSLDQAGVEGIIRNQLLSLAPKLGLTVEIGHFSIDDVQTADELMVCNSLIGIWPITRLGQHAYTVGPYTRQLMSDLKQRMSPC